MSTHSYIGYELPDGSITYSYCHFDGYLTGVGAMVVGKDRDQATALVDGGDMRAVGEPFFNHPHHMGETWEELMPKRADNREAFCELAYEMGHGYLFGNDGIWYAWRKGGTSGLKPLREELDRALSESRHD